MEPFLSLAQLVTHSGLSRSTLKRHLGAARDALPHYRVGGRVLVRVSDFEAWMVARRQTESRAGGIARQLLLR